MHNINKWMNEQMTSILKASRYPSGPGSSYGGLLWRTQSLVWPKYPAVPASGLEGMAGASYTSFSREPIHRQGELELGHCGLLSD